MTYYAKVLKGLTKLIKIISGIFQPKETQPNIKPFANLSQVKKTLWVVHGLRGQLRCRHKSLNFTKESHDAAKILDADDKTLGDETHTGVCVRHEKRKCRLHQSLLPGQSDLLILVVH